MTLSAAIHSPFLIVPVLDSIVEAEGRPPQFAGQLSILLRLKGESAHECPASHGTTQSDLQGLANGSTDHFADAVLQRFHDGAQAVEFQDHAGEFVTGEATDGLQVLCFVASVVGADGGAGAVHHVVVEGQKDVGSGWETTCERKASAADVTSPCRFLVVRDISFGRRDECRVSACKGGVPCEGHFCILQLCFPGMPCTDPGAACFSWDILVGFPKSYKHRGTHCWSSLCS